MADISKIGVKGETYDIKDAVAREAVANIKGGLEYIGFCTFDANYYFCMETDHGLAVDLVDNEVFDAAPYYEATFVKIISEYQDAFLPIWTDNISGGTYANAVGIGNSGCFCIPKAAICYENDTSLTLKFYR